MYSTKVKNIGAFMNECNQWYTYRFTDDPWAKSWCYVHEIDMCDGSVRFANVFKTRIHVAIDEDETGHPINETWQIKKHEKHE